MGTSVGEGVTLTFAQGETATKVCSKRLVYLPGRHGLFV